MEDKSSTVYLLGLETSGISSLVALSRGEQLLGHILLNIRNIHSRLLAPMVHQLLKYTGIPLSRINGICLSAGPGSFTGLRIGYSLAKGLAHSLHIPVVEIPTLDVWAYQHGATHRPVLAVIDAHREEVFVRKYRWEGETLRAETDSRVLPIARLPELIHEPTEVVGGDLLKLADKIRQAVGEMAIFPAPLSTEPFPSALMALGYQRFSRQEFCDIATCEPRYLRAFRGVM